jgi:hypothetical protein
MDEKEFEKLKEQLKQGTFFYHRFGLLVKGKVNDAFLINDDTLHISFNGGYLELIGNKVKKVKRPSDIIAEFEWCYLLKNEYDQEIGYIGLKKEVG